MLLQILNRTPLFVWLILTALILVGWRQSRTRTISLKRVLISPILMLALALWGVIGNFGTQASILSAWLMAVSITAFLVQKQRLAPGHQYDAQQQRFTLPGSYLPLLLMLGIFVLKYVSKVVLVMTPALAQETQFALLCAVAFGICSGLFTGRALRLIQLAKRSQSAFPLAATSA